MVKEETRFPFTGSSSFGTAVLEGECLVASEREEPAE